MQASSTKHPQVLRSEKVNTELNDSRKIIRLRKTEVSVERNSVYKVDENLAEHDIHSLPCSYATDVMSLLP